MRDDLATAARPARPPQNNIPQSKEQRERLLDIIRNYVRSERPTGPLSIEELKEHCSNVLKLAKLAPQYHDYTAVLVNNEVWRDIVAAIPYEKRLLLLPKCLRDPDNCQGELDEFGLICNHCGSCVIDELQNQAERLGYAVLVAEGSPIVTSLIESGKVEAVIGVSCLSVLEQVFPYMSAGAIPGIAIPLLQDGCANTSVDIDWVWNAIWENSADETRRLNLEELRRKVDSWFTPESLEPLLGPADDQTKKLAIDWLAKAGKRWRPFLAVCAYRAIKGDNEEQPGGELMQVAIAIECFHKASLIHDDIEDGDKQRYDEETMHVKYGVPIALNVGDFLLGEGYRLLAEANTSGDVRAAMLRVAAEGHRDLCLGQGKELSWLRSGGPLSSDEVIEIYEKKTSPAFAVALNLGAILAGGAEELAGVFKQYSDALGAAYQIKDDIDDFDVHNFKVERGMIRPSLLLAAAYERAEDAGKAAIDLLWRRDSTCRGTVDIGAILEKLRIRTMASAAMESYKSKAIGSLVALSNPSLKGLLRRVVAKIFNDIDVMSCCNDYQAGHVRGGESS